MKIKLGAPPTTAGQEHVAAYVYDDYEVVGPAPEIARSETLTDEVVDAFLREHQNDPVNEVQLERVRRRFNEKFQEKDRDRQL